MHISCKLNFDDYFGCPQIQIAVDQTELYQGDAMSDLEFEIDVSPGDHVFSIRHQGKTNQHGNDLHDRHVELTNLRFDGVDLDQFEFCRITHRGKFYPEYDPDYVSDCARAGTVLPEFLQPNHYLGHNGIWKLDFKYPALLWIIQEQNPSGMHLEDTIFGSSQDVLNDIKDFFNL
jgi:hypothetical protein